MDFKKIVSELLEALRVALWFVLLLFPIIVMKVSVITGVASVQFRWHLVPVVLVAAFLLAYVWKKALVWKEVRESKPSSDSLFTRFSKRYLSEKSNKILIQAMLFLVLALIIIYPLALSMYQTKIMIAALIYVILALGLNIVVGLGGLLNLGYAAFFAVGAYTYGLLWKFAGPVFIEAGINAGLLFWIALPLAGILAALFGILLSLPVLRLKGDYLAIITLAFAEIVRMFLQNQTELTGGAAGISQIPHPWFFGIKLRPSEATVYVYYIAVVLVLLTIFVVRRIEDSRIGRALEAMKEDEVACEAMGIDLTRNKMITFALGSFWAGIAGVVFATQTTFINPESFTMWESFIVLMAVVIGGTGSVPGVICGALILKLLPEYFRPLAQYRMLIYGVAMIVIIIFKPEGLIPRKRKIHKFSEKVGLSAKGGAKK